MKRNAQIWWPLTQVSVLLSPVLIVLGVVVAGASSSYLEPYWLDVASKSITSIIFIAPAFAAMSAWDASRWRHLAIASVRSPAGLLLRHVVWVATATSIIFGVTHLYLLTEVGTPVGKPTVGIILMAVWATTGYAAVGFLLGWFVPRLVAVPIAFAGTWFWVAYTPAIQPPAC